MNHTLHSLRLAMDMERDKRDFYMMASYKLTSPFDHRIFRRMADHATDHLRMLKDVYETAETAGIFPTIWYKAETMWERGIRQLEGAKTVSDVDILKTAVELQLKSYEFYHDLGAKAVNPFEKAFYYALACEERKDFLIINHTYSYMIDPEGWFESVERISLDGG